MAVPKRKVSKSSRNKRRAHDALKRKNLVEDENGERKLPHHISTAGEYRGRQVIEAKESF